MRTIKTYFKGAPFYIASSYRNVVFFVFVFVLFFCVWKELAGYREDDFSSVIRFREVGDRFRICPQSGIIAKVTWRTTSRFGDGTYTEVSGKSRLENRNMPSDRRENSNVFVTDGETRGLRRSE
jgi:hypothetical protein